MKFYTHDDPGEYHTHMGHIGYPREVSCLGHCCARAMGYRTSLAPNKMSKTALLVREAIKAGAHPNSHRIKLIKETGVDTSF